MDSRHLNPKEANSKFAGSSRLCSAAQTYDIRHPYTSFSALTYFISESATPILQQKIIKNVATPNSPSTVALGI